LRSYITDNAAMIAAAGYLTWLRAKRDESQILDADAGWAWAGQIQ